MDNNSLVNFGFMERGSSTDPPLSYSSTLSFYIPFSFVSLVVISRTRFSHLLPTFLLFRTLLPRVASGVETAEGREGPLRGEGGGRALSTAGVTSHISLFLARSVSRTISPSLSPTHV